MTDVAIRVEGLSKQYRIGRRERYKTLRESLTGAFLAPFRYFRRNPQSAIRNPQSEGAPFRRIKLNDHKTTDNTTTDQSPVFSGPVVSSPSSRSPVVSSPVVSSQPSPSPVVSSPVVSGHHEWLWALKDVSFEVKHGEVIGIIGRNGAGKSTLLKILSRITEPTEGRAEVFGRVGSLLEVGTGFHPELTGRENVYLNGAILGMKKAEIDRKFDEIVAFAEVEKFLDTPVRHYSSGMYVRLAFAVAAHLEPDILLLDEVLAVGDAAFQKKCFGKMGDVAKEGRTVLFVSHNMHAVSLLCPKTILLHAGNIAGQGPTPNVIGQYIASEANQSAEAIWSFDEAPSTLLVKLRAVRVLHQEHQVKFDVHIDEPLTLQMEFWILRTTKMTPSFHLYNQHGILLFAVQNTHDEVWGSREYNPGLYTCSCTIPGNFLNEGQHYVTIYLTSDNNAGWTEKLYRDQVISFRVNETGSSRGDFTGKWEGLVRPILTWVGSRIGQLPSIGDER